MIINSHPLTSREIRLNKRKCNSTYSFSRTNSFILGVWAFYYWNSQEFTVLFIFISKDNWMCLNANMVRAF